MSADLYAKASGTELFDAVSSQTATRIAKVRMLVLDVDGVLTDGGLYYGPDGAMSKRFNVQDGLGINLARFCGIRVAVITGQDQPCVAARLQYLGIEDYYPGFMSKCESYETVRQKYGLSHEETAFVGDDWIDLPVMHRVGAPFAVSNAQPEVKAAALYTTCAHGGNGAVREIVRLILHSQGQLDQAFSAWMEQLNL